MSIIVNEDKVNSIMDCDGHCVGTLISTDLYDGEISGYRTISVKGMYYGIGFLLDVNNGVLNEIYDMYSRGNESKMRIQIRSSTRELQVKLSDGMTDYAWYDLKCTLLLSIGELAKDIMDVNTSCIEYVECRLNKKVQEIAMKIYKEPSFAFVKSVVSTHVLSLLDCRIYIIPVYIVMLGGSALESKQWEGICDAVVKCKYDYSQIALVSRAVLKLADAHYTELEVPFTIAFKSLGGNALRFNLSSAGFKTRDLELDVSRLLQQILLSYRIEFSPNDMCQVNYDEPSEEEVDIFIKQNIDVY